VSKKKLIHFEENLAFPHLFQPGYHELQKHFPLKSNWHEQYFGNRNPIVIELGCGKGEYTVGLARRHPEKNFIGIDYKGARLWRGCKSVEEHNLKNVAFIRTRVDNLEKLFGTKEADELWITFPDPFPGKARKRLTSPGFLAKYRNILKEDGIIHLKTDDFDYYSYSMDIISGEQHPVLYSTDDLYNSGQEDEVIAIQTFYEKMWLEQEKKICYLKFRLKTVN
jgi:tRNA (guanine-N7-)-methyltransferase